MSWRLKITSCKILDTISTSSCRTFCRRTNLNLPIRTKTKVLIINRLSLINLLINRSRRVSSRRLIFIKMMNWVKKMKIRRTNRRKFNSKRCHIWMRVRNFQKGRLRILMMYRRYQLGLTWALGQHLRRWIKMSFQFPLELRKRISSCSSIKKKISWRQPQG